MKLRLLTAAGALSLALAAPAHADIALGAQAPNFVKTALGGGSVSLADYPDKVVVLFLLGYGCPYCQANGPSVQQNLWQYYESTHPNEVQVIGVDLWNGSAAQMNTFKQTTGTTYPLLLMGATAPGGNVETLYGTYDNFIVINRQGVVRYHAALTWPHGNRYHLDEIRAAVDSLLPPPLDAGPTVSSAVRLSIAPNPARAGSSITFELPAAVAHARVDVHDLAGRRVATLWDAPAPAGATRLAWRTDAGGAPLAPGVYLVRAQLGDRTLQRRVVVVR